MNFPTQHLWVMALSQPPPEHSMSSNYTQNGLHIKHGADGTIHMLTPRADVICVSYQSTSDTVAPIVASQLALQALHRFVVDGQRTAQGCLKSKKKYVYCHTYTVLTFIQIAVMSRGKNR